jgi:hypothetical protein
LDLQFNIFPCILKLMRHFMLLHAYQTIKVADSKKKWLNHNYCGRDEAI